MAQHDQKSAHISVFQKRLIATTAMTMAGFLAATPAHAMDLEVPDFEGFGPSSADMVAISVATDTGAGTLDVFQNASQQVYYWRTFNIGEDAQATFTMHNANQIALNRVTGPQTDPTSIRGQLSSNGRIIILDRNGVMFTETSQVDVGSLVATTGGIGAKWGNRETRFAETGELRIRNTDGRSSTAEISNAGNITAAQGGLVALVAPYVRNSGRIRARLGNVTLASAKQFTVDFMGDGLINIALNRTLSEGLSENTGTLRADGGVITMSANMASDVVSEVINADGIINANAFHQDGGKIVLSSTGGGKVKVAGTLSTNTNDVVDNDVHKDAGEIDITGEDIEITDTAELLADASGRFGSGGSVTAYARNKLSFAGHINVSGGSETGDGGSASLSGENGIGYFGTVDASGEVMGLVTIDPAVVSIGNATTGDVVNIAALAETLGLSNVSIIAGDKIVLLDDADMSRYGTDTSPWWRPDNRPYTTGNLTLEAPTLDLLYDLTIGGGTLTLDTSTVNLGGILGQYRPTGWFGRMEYARLGRSDLAHVGATEVNVVGDGALIQQGIDMAAAGAPVTVSEGTYSENLEIYKALILQAKAGDTPIIQGTDTFGRNIVILITASDVTVDGFDITNGTGRFGIPLLQNYGILAEGGVSGLTLQNNTISPMLMSGIKLDGVSSSTVMGNTISIVSKGIEVVGGTLNGLLSNTILGSGTGITLSGVTHALVSGNTITGTLGSGISAFDVSFARFLDNVISLTGGSGLSVDADGGTDIEASGNTITGTGGDGLSISNAGDVTVSGNVVTGAGGDAIKLENIENALVTLNAAGGAVGHALGLYDVESAAVFLNALGASAGDGIHAEDGESLRAFLNLIGLTGGNGISTDGTDDVSIFLNAILGAGKNGISIDGAYDANVIANLVKGADENGVIVEGSGSVDVKRNIVKDSGQHGIVSANNYGDVDIEDNKVKNSGWNGIYAYKFGPYNGTYRVRDNFVKDSGWNGIKLYGVSTALVGDNTVIGSDANGIYAWDVDALWAYDNFVAGSGEDGMRAYRVGNANIIDNKVFGSDGNGISAERSGGVDVKDNLVKYSDKNGIALEDNNGDVEVEDNTVTHSGRNGIYAFKDSRYNGTYRVKDNFVYDSGWSGIKLMGVRTGYVSDNTVLKSGWNGIYGYEIGGTFWAYDNFVGGSDKDGIRAYKVDNANITDNKVFGSDGDGISVEKSGGVDIKDNLVKYSDGHGIVSANNYGDVEIEDNTVKRSGKNGIYAYATYPRRGTHTIKDNYVTGSDWNGIKLYGLPSAWVTHNTVFGSGWNGISAWDVDTFWAYKNLVGWSDEDGIRAYKVGNANIIKNTVFGSDGNGISVEKSSGVDVIANLVKYNDRNGIALINNKGGDVKYNIVKENGWNGIFIFEEDHDRRRKSFTRYQDYDVKGNYVTGSGWNGIKLWGVKAADVERNIVKDSGWNGIAAYDVKKLNVSDNWLFGGNRNGIAAYDVGFANIAGNWVKGFYNGIRISGAYIAGVRGNLISGVYNDGIFADDAGFLYVVGNRVKKYGHAGVHVANSGKVLIKDNRISAGKKRRRRGERRDYDGQTIGILLGEGGGYFDTFGGADFSGNWSVSIVDNKIKGNDIGLSARAFNNGKIKLSGNRFKRNTVGAWFGSGLIDLTGDANIFKGGEVALRFERAQKTYYPFGRYFLQGEGESEESGPVTRYAKLKLVDDTLGTTEFYGQSRFFVELLNGAFFAPGSPTIIDGTNAIWDGIEGGLMTRADLIRTEEKIHDYDDDMSLGQIFPGFTLNFNALLSLQDILNGGYQFGQSGFIITGLPNTGGGNNGGGNTSPQFLNSLNPAGGGDNPDDLNNINPGSGDNVVQGGCWSDAGAAGGNTSVSFDMSDDASAAFASAGCTADSDI
ncbi:MAG: right-handed parallel beta-helix repeat-containing protein [Alphaproteobacteria bacterium]|nr:right-handed parallel beta-helix repeat-containing protein [Alphaproteobacteria bacterium]